jgi:hypothetical protein
MGMGVSLYDQFWPLDDGDGKNAVSEIDADGVVTLSQCPCVVYN